MNLTIHFILGICLLVSNCTNSNNTVERPHNKSNLEIDLADFTELSTLENTYKNFHSPNAINHIAAIENEYFRNYEDSISRFYGTIWRENAEFQMTEFQLENDYKKYIEELGEGADSMHCTIYAVEALQAGMGNDFITLQKQHQALWNHREHAGWSIGHLLVEKWGWKAYLILDSYGNEFDKCKKDFDQKKIYDVWRQPNIPITAMYVREEQDSLILDLLNQHEFGWGFSDQGIHTWITRFDNLKECYWGGAPGKKYEMSPTPLFKKTNFLHFLDYHSHVVIFPPKKEN